MNSKERVLRAIHYQGPDWVPVDFWWGHEMRDKLLRHLNLKDADPLQDFLSSDIR